MELTENEAVYLLAFMMAMADGQITEEESRVIADRVAHHRPPLSDERCAELVYAARGSYENPGNILTHIAAALPGEAREEALHVAVDVLWADGSFEPSEMASLQEFCDALDVPRAELSRMIAERSQ